MTEQDEIPEQDAADESGVAGGDTEPKKRRRRSKAEMEAAKAEDQAKVDKYLVGLLHNADMEIDAKDAEEAVAKYKKHNGILDSIHPFKVVKKGE